MKIGDLVRHRDAADWSPPLRSGLIVGQPRSMSSLELEQFAEAIMWRVLWSGAGRVNDHRGYELRVTHECG